MRSECHENRGNGNRNGRLLRPVLNISVCAIINGIYVPTGAEPGSAVSMALFAGSSSHQESLAGVNCGV